MIKARINCRGVHKMEFLNIEHIEYMKKRCVTVGEM